MVDYVSEKDFYLTEDLMRIFGLRTRGAIKRWQEKGLLPPHVMLGLQRKRWFKEDIDQIVAFRLIPNVYKSGAEQKAAQKAMVATLIKRRTGAAPDGISVSPFPGPAHPPENQPTSSADARAAG